MSSYWEQHHWYNKVDYAIIGSGIVGLSTALELRSKYPDAGISVFERAPIPHGASTKNAGFACFGTLTEIIDDLEVLSEQEVIDLIKLRWDGLQRLLKRVSTHQMSYKKTGGYEVFNNDEELEQHSSKLKFVNELIESSTGIANVLNYSTEYVFKNLCKTSIKNEEEGQLNPVLLIKHLLKLCRKEIIQIHFNAELTAFEDSKTDVELHINDHFQIRAKKLIICNNAFAKQLLPSLDITPARNQVIVSKPLPKGVINGTFHFDKGYVYFRNIEDRILIGGARNIDKANENTTEFGENSKIINHLIHFAEDKILGFPLEIETKWSGIIATGTTKSSIIKQHSNNVYMGVRQGGMGVAIGSEVAYQLSLLID